jgi:diguanylate cyclase (GGDEF)-like protein/PAS domain S-box-containing protein
MTKLSVRTSLYRTLQKLSFMQGSVSTLLALPAICIVLAALLWSMISSEITQQKTEFEKDVLTETAMHARVFAQQLSKAFEQADKITLAVKQEWEQSKGKMRLETMFRHGLNLSLRHLSVSIINRDGTPVSHNQGSLLHANLADRDYFTYHQRMQSDAFRVSEPIAGRKAGSTIILFTRRLNAADGTFDGVVMVTVKPTYFAAFYDNTMLGGGGTMAVVGKDRVLRMAKTGDSIRTTADTALKDIAVFESDKGAALMTDVPWSGDNEARFVAWETLQSYPFIAVVGLAKRELIAAHEKTWASYHKNAVIGSIILFLFALVTALLFARLIWRKHQAEQAREAYWVVTEGGSEGFYMWRALRDQEGASVDFEIVDCNERGATFFGLQKSQMLGKTLSSLTNRSYFHHLLQICDKAMKSGLYEDEFRIPPGSMLKMEWVYRKFVRTSDGVAVTLEDISAAKAHEHELVRLGNEDDLTGLPNRHWLMEFLPAAMQRTRNQDGMMGVLFIDLDGFKNVNDTLGHSAGDELLQAAAQRLKLALRPTDNVVRFGGDEFIVILEPVAEESAAERVAERIAEAFFPPFDLSRGRHTVGTSIGITLFPRDGEDPETLLKNADMAMYAAKLAGKGRHHFYRSELYEGLKTQIDTEQQLRRAIDEDQFEMHYQPRVDTMTGELVGLEALVRWQHPERGMLPPDTFIPRAETTGLIIPLGELVMHKVCAQLALWQRQEIAVVPVSVNVSVKQFNEGNVKSLITSCLATHDIAPELIEIELTESAMMGDVNSILLEVAAINALGIKIHIDDFGTGYSSLSLLRMLNMDVLKVDRSFTSQLGQNKQGEIFFKAIVSMAKALNMRVVAEGVETQEQVRILQELSCDEIQGYFASKPVPAKAIPALLHERFLLKGIAEQADVADAG